MLLRCQSRLQSTFDDATTSFSFLVPLALDSPHQKNVAFYTPAVPPAPAVQTARRSLGRTQECSAQSHSRWCFPSRCKSPRECVYAMIPYIGRRRVQHQSGSREVGGTATPSRGILEHPPPHLARELTALRLNRATFTSAQVACNGHVEYCARSYSNLTYIGAHNSYSVGAGNRESERGVRSMLMYWHSSGGESELHSAAPARRRDPTTPSGPSLPPWHLSLIL